MQELNSSIIEKKRIILLNPDGSYTHCYKTGERDSSCETKNLVSTNNTYRTQRNNFQLNNQIDLSDDELRYILETTAQDEYPILVDQILSLFRKYRLYFFILKCIEMSIFWFLMFITWNKRESTITLMQDLYKEINSKESSYIFYTCYSFSLCTNLIFYPYGFYALLRKNVKLLKIYTNLLLASSILTIFLIYINILFIFIFTARLVLYGFSKFLFHLLVSILLIPRQINENTNYNTLT